MAERLDALRKSRDAAARVVQIAEARYKTGQGSQADALLARAELLEVRIELLRAELKSKPRK